MARYKLTISFELDEAYPMSLHTDVARNIVESCCPSNFGFCGNCDLLNCKRCWETALKEGVLADAAENVHVERLG